MSVRSGSRAAGQAGVLLVSLLLVLAQPAQSQSQSLAHDEPRMKRQLWGTTYFRMSQDQQDQQDGGGPGGLAQAMLDTPHQIESQISADIEDNKAISTQTLSKYLMSILASKQRRRSSY